MRDTYGLIDWLSRYKLPLSNAWAPDTTLNGHFQPRDKSTATGKRRGIYNGDSMMWAITVNKYTIYLRPSDLGILYP